MNIGTGDSWKYLSSHQRNDNGNKQNSYRRFLCWIFRKRDNSQCQICGGPGHNVHHILPKRDYPQWKKEADNCLTVCFECHGLCDDGFWNEDFLFGRVGTCTGLNPVPGNYFCLMH